MNCPICQYPNRPAARFCASCRTPLILQGKYRITRLLGRGGYGAVFEAEHVGLGGAKYAIKELLPDPNGTPQQVQAASDQFHLEASLLANLRHHALPQVMDFFAEGGRDYLTMEFVEGETLEEALDRQRAPFAEAQVLEWASELCDVLTYLHTRQPSPVIHRDVKPSNIKLTPEGQLMLIDFGIAKFLASGVRTKGAARAVSPPYSPMEQYGRGVGTDARSDIYALGVTLYQLLTNHLPPEAPDRASEATISPRQWNSFVSPETEAIVLRATAISPADRYQSAAQMKDALTRNQPDRKSITPAYQPLPRSVPVPYATPGPVLAPSSPPQVVPARGSLIGPSEVGCLLFLLVIGGLFLGLAQQIQQSHAATTAAVESRATTGAQTAIAEAQATAYARSTAQAALRTSDALLLNASLVHPPSDGRLEARADNNVPVESAGVSLQDLIAEARFFNPYDVSVGSWDYGIMFRYTGSAMEYRLIVTSARMWYFTLTNGDANVGPLASGTLENLDLSPNGSNQLRVTVKGGAAWFFVNNEYQALLDVSGKTSHGDVMIATAAFVGDQINGKSTSYTGFTVWAVQ